ncbi:hypothetical protein GCM10027446_01530 [Angustibacter peucedani]
MTIVSRMGGDGTELHELPDGSLPGPNGVTYRRTPRRLKRRMCSDLIAGGAPVVTSVYPEGARWHEGGPGASSVWTRVRPTLAEGRPPPVTGLQWVGHLWESERGEPLLVFEGQH